MKKTALFLFVIIGTLWLPLSSCKKLKKLLTFNIDNSATFTIPSSYGTGINIPLVFNSPNVQSSSSQSFANNDTRADHVQDVKLSKLDLSITSPAGKTFSFLNSIKIYISGDGLPEVLLAYKDNIPNDVGSSISLTTTGEKLDSYIKASSYNLRYEIVTDETFTEDINLLANMVFTVTAKPLK
ncbi:MAG TPA: hypothetical protein VNB90_14225 [Cytophagaceae bacterium]|nr:hypothetical protein [Cytophagaceae bacterium]